MYIYNKLHIKGGNIKGKKDRKKKNSLKSVKERKYAKKIEGDKV